MSLIQRDGAYKVHLANFSRQSGGGAGGEWEGGHFEDKERLTRLEMEKESQYGAGERAAGRHAGGGACGGRAENEVPGGAVSGASPPPIHGRPSVDSERWTRAERVSVRG